MCWNSILQIDKREHIAEEDIPMFKMMMVNGQTPFRCYPIKFGIKLATVELFIDEGLNGDLVITQGFHSYSRQDCFYAIEYGISIYSRNRAKEEKEDGDWCLINRFDYTPYEEIVVLEGIIPKGSCYYKNDNGEMVSDRIVLNGVLADDEQ